MLQTQHNVATPYQYLADHLVLQLVHLPELLRKDAQFRRVLLEQRQRQAHRQDALTDRLSQPSHSHPPQLLLRAQFLEVRLLVAHVDVVDRLHRARDLEVLH